MEAWEHIAPEDPPGFLFDEAESGYPRTVVAPEGDQSAWVEFVSPESARAWAWACLGGRKRYAELIAFERVQEVAAKLGYGHNVEVHFCSLGRVVVDVVSPIDARHLFGHGQGPTLCDAAWACIQALGGGE